MPTEIEDYGTFGVQILNPAPSGLGGLAIQTSLKGLSDALATTNTAVATKASSSDLTAGLAGKASTSHTHAQADVTNLTSDLAAKATTSALTAHTGETTTAHHAESYYDTNDGTTINHNWSSGNAHIYADSSCTINLTGTPTNGSELVVTVEAIDNIDVTFGTGITVTSGSGLPNPQALTTGQRAIFRIYRSLNVSYVLFSIFL
jgi:hypothetical protein